MLTRQRSGRSGIGTRLGLGLRSGPVRAGQPFLHRDGGLAFVEALLAEIEAGVALVGAALTGFGVDVALVRQGVTPVSVAVGSCHA